MNIVNNERVTKIVSVALSVVLGVLVISFAANAVTTISTNIDTGGTLNADGAATLGSTLEVTGATTLTGDVTMSGGNGALTLTTSNSATSTATIGCVQTYATSTATAIRLTIGTEVHGTTTSQGSASNGLVAWQYGSCPI